LPDLINICSELEDLPELTRMPNLHLPGAAFANIMMVFEFLHLFGETLGFGKLQVFGGSAN
jgi:hypothetical protein